MAKWANQVLTCPGPGPAGATFDIMSDLTFAEPLHMLDDAEYTPWVKLIFSWLKLATRIRAIRYLSKHSNALVDFVTSRNLRRLHTVEEHHRYVNDRVEKRLRTKPDHPDIWSQMTQKMPAPLDY